MKIYGPRFHVLDHLRPVFKAASQNIIIVQLYLTLQLHHNFHHQHHHQHSYQKRKKKKKCPAQSSHQQQQQQQQQQTSTTWTTSPPNSKDRLSVCPTCATSFPAGPRLVNPLLDELTLWFEEEMVRLFPDAKVRAKIRKSDFPGFVCLTFPASPLPRLRTITYYALWSCLWDDEMESSSTQTLAHRELEYVRHLLGFSFSHPSKRHQVVPPPTKPSQLFAEPAKVLRENWSEQQLKRFMGEMELYIGACAVEEGYPNGKGVLPTAEEYTGNRMGSSSGGTYFALAEFMINVEIPQEVHDLEEMRTIWAELCRTVSWVNDLISLKKEINSSLYSLIPITMNETGQDLNTVVSEVLQELESSRERFESAAGELLFKIMNENSKVRNDVERFIESCTIMVTGYTEWALQSDRYAVKEYMQEDGSFLVPL